MLAPDPLASALRARQQRALAKALAWGLQGDVQPLGTMAYAVPSRTEPGRSYRVARTRRAGAEHLICDCPAGLAGVPCVHTAAVYIHRLEQRTGGTVTAVRPA